MPNLANRLLTVALVALLASTPAPAQEVGLSPTLVSIKRTHTVRLGYREASPPFSYLDQATRPIGYSLELCKAITEEISAEVAETNLTIDYVKVTPETRIPAVLNNKIDLECGSTTASPDRARRVAFSPTIYIAGTKLMVPIGSAVSGITDLKSKTIVVTRGTTNERAIEIANKKSSLGLTVVATTDHEQSYQLLADGKAQAFATDDILLYGLIARHSAQDTFKVVGEFLSYDPYGIMFRKGDPQFADVVERTFRKLATNHDLVPLYQKWLMDRLPTGERLGVPMSPELEHSFRMLDDSSQGIN
jgi:ABC-type amino acid transport substrate-binding protein